MNQNSLIIPNLLRTKQQKTHEQKIRFVRFLHIKRHKINTAWQVAHHSKHGKNVVCQAASRTSHIAVKRGDLNLRWRQLTNHVLIEHLVLIPSRVLIIFLGHMLQQCKSPVLQLTNCIPGGLSTEK